MGEFPTVKRITQSLVVNTLPLPLSTILHKYKSGHLLLICGSKRYAGGAILTGLGARASGIGMLSIAVPESIKPLLVSHLPEALIIGCPETNSGAISHLQLPAGITLDSFTVIACGPGLTTEVTPIVEQVMKSEVPLILDADSLKYE